MAKVVLQGITWGHSRGITPLLAASQRFEELNPDIEIRWKKRTLQEFADFPIEKLTPSYDLLIIDHPWVGTAAATQTVLPLDQYLSEDFLAVQSRLSVGASHQSYNYEGHQWALPIDAATPVASFRKDLLGRNDELVPSTWNELLALAKKGRVAIPAIPIDTLMNFYMFCNAIGTEPFANDEEVINKESGLEVLKLMQELYSSLNPEMFRMNPIAVAERMSSTDDYWYCPFAYGYSNFARVGYARNILTYGNLVSYENKTLRSTLGGTGLAISAESTNRDAALAFASYVCSPEIQSTLYAEHGGQPGLRNAWESSRSNQLTGDFFLNTLPTLDDAYVRPRYHGYLYFQDHAGDPLQHFLADGGNPEFVLQEMNSIYRNSLTKSINKVI